jgi:hypothetical protein
MGLRATPNGSGGYTLSWRDHGSRSTRSFYTIYRAPTTWKLPKGSGNFPTVRRGLLCEKSPGGADKCSIEMTAIGSVRKTTASDTTPRGRWTYRVGVAGNWLDDPSQGDVFVLSEPRTVTLR